MKTAARKRSETTMGAAQVERVVNGFIAMPFKKKVTLLKKAGLLKISTINGATKPRPKRSSAR